MNIFFREMKAYRKSLIIWCIGILFMVVSGMAKYASFSSSGQSISDIMAKMPNVVKVIIGVGTFDVSKASGYYGMLFFYLLIMAAIHAAMLGANIISKEESDKTSEFLYVKPVSRFRIITSKLSAAILNVLIFNIVTLVSSIWIFSYYGKGESINNEIFRLMVGMFILQLIFLSIGTAIAAISRNSKSAASVATGILLFTFILSMAIDLNEKLNPLKYITPFKYFETKDLMFGTGFKPEFVVLSAVIISVLLGSTYVFYKKRDLNV